MGNQYNKVQKRKRRARYMDRIKSRKKAERMKAAK